MKKIIFAIMLITPLLFLSGTGMGADRPDPPGIHVVQPQVVAMDDFQPYTLCEAYYHVGIIAFSVVQTPVFGVIAGEEPRSQEGSYPLKFSTSACVECPYSLNCAETNVKRSAEGSVIFLKIQLPGDKMHRAC